MKKIWFALAILLVLLALAAPWRGANASGLALSSGPVTLIGTLTLDPGAGPKGVTVDEKNNLIYVVGFNLNLVYQIDGVTNSMGIHATQGDHPNQVMVKPDSQRFYVTQRDSDSVAVFDTVSLYQVGTTPAGKHPWGIAGPSNSSDIFVANFDSSNIMDIPYVGDNPVPPMTFPLPYAGAPTSDGPALASYFDSFNRLFVTGWGTGNLYVIDQFKHIYHPFSIQPGAMGVYADALGSVYLTNRLTQKLYVTDGTLMDINAMVPTELASFPNPVYGVVANPHTNHIFVVGETPTGEVLYVINRGTRQVIQTLPLGNANEGEGGQGIAINLTTNRVYVSNFADSKLNVIQDAPEGPTPTPTITQTPTQTPTPSPTPEAIRMSGVVYDAALGTTHGLANGSVSYQFSCVSDSWAAGTDATGAYWVPVPADKLHQCGKIALYVSADNYQTRMSYLTESDLLANPHRDWGLTKMTAALPYVITTSPVGTHPKGIAASQPGIAIYTALYDASQMAMVKPFTMLVNAQPGTQGLHPNQVLAPSRVHPVYVTNRDSNNVAAIDPYTWTPLGTWPTGSLPWGLTFNDDNRRLYVANFGSNSVSVIDLTQNTNATLPLPGDQPTFMTLSNGKAYVPGYVKGNLYTIDSSNTVSNPITVGEGAFGVTAEPSGNRVYLTNRTTRKLYIIDSVNDNVVQVVTLPSPGYALTVNPATNHLFVVAANTNQVYVLNATTGALLKTLPVGAQDAAQGGQGITLLDVSNRVYVANYAGGSITTIQDIAGQNPTAAASAAKCTVPVLASRPNGWVSGQRRVILDWTDPNCGPRFEIQVRQGSTTGKVVDSNTTLSISKYTTVSLIPGKAYYWHVRACNANGCSAWTGWWKFSLAANAR